MNILNWCYLKPHILPDLKNVMLLFFCTDLPVVQAEAFSRWVRKLIRLKIHSVEKKSLIFTWRHFLCRAMQILLPQQDRSGSRIRISSSGWGKDRICLLALLSQVGLIDLFAHTYICVIFFN